MRFTGLVTALLVAGVWGSIGEEATESNNVVVYKCCPANQQLVEEGLECRTKGELSWAPLIYSPVSMSFLPPGTTPTHWRWEVSRPLACFEPRFYPVSPTVVLPPYVLFENGNLNLISNMGDQYSPAAYCVDKTGALVCPRGEAKGPPGPQVLRG